MYKKGTKNTNADSLSRIEPESMEINHLSDDNSISSTSIDQVIQSDINQQEKTKLDTHLATLYHNKISILTLQLDKLEDTLNSLKPTYRSKRGLINGLGSVLKSITGNLDNDDYIEINQAIQQLYNNEGQITKEMNEQINLNNEMMERFKEIKEVINNSSITLTKELEITRNYSYELRSIMLIDQYLYHTAYNIKYLQEHLDNIIQIILLAKIQVISHHILDKSEMHYIHNLFEKQKITIHSDNELYKLLTLKAYYNQSTIIMSVQIPKFHPDKFQQYLLQPTTINNSFSIYIPHSSIIANNQYYQYIEQPCTMIEGAAYCEETKIQLSKQYCITQIIYNLLARCNIINGSLPEEVKQLQPNYLYVYSKKPISFSSNCEQKQKEIHGIKIIKFTDCTIEINGILYENYAATFLDKKLLQPFNDIIVEKTEPAINLPMLHDWNLKNQEKLNELNFVTNQHAISHYTSWALYCIAILIILIYFIISHFKKNKTGQQNSTSPTSNDQKSYRFWPSLRREELRIATPHTPNTTLTKQQCSSIPIQEVDTTLITTTSQQCSSIIT